MGEMVSFGVLNSDGDGDASKTMRVKGELVAIDALNWSVAMFDYALYRMVEGQTVLIHSAVGIDGNDHVDAADFGRVELAGDVLLQITNTDADTEDVVRVVLTVRKTDRDW